VGRWDSAEAMRFQSCCNDLLRRIGLSQRSVVKRYTSETTTNRAKHGAKGREKRMPGMTPS